VPSSARFLSPRRVRPFVVFRGSRHATRPCTATGVRRFVWFAAVLQRCGITTVFVIPLRASYRWRYDAVKFPSDQSITLAAGRSLAHSWKKTGEIRIDYLPIYNALRIRTRRSDGDGQEGRDEGKGARSRGDTETATEPLRPEHARPQILRRLIRRSPSISTLYAPFLARPKYGAGNATHYWPDVARLTWRRVCRDRQTSERWLQDRMWKDVKVPPVYRMNSVRMFLPF